LGQVIFEANFIHDDGRTEKLFSRTLDPMNTGDRGAQVVKFALPTIGLGEIELKFLPGDPVSPNQVRFISARAVGAGPDLVISPDRILVPTESQMITGESIHVFTNLGWFAHAPSRVVYDCPPDLRAITFGFMLPESAYIDEQGNRRSDGVSAVVEFIDNQGNADLLYQRTIDPYRNPQDRGMIRPRVELPGRAGRLVIRLTTGSGNDSTYDWSYLADHFTGEVLRPESTN
jgi:hypothetical protein